MSPVYHTVYAGFFSAVYGSVTHSLWGSVLCFVSGVLMDLDHLLDYILAKKRLTFSYKTLLSYFGSEKSGKIYIIFHSYEFIFLLWLFIAFYQLSVVWVGLAVGVTTHILLDKFHNPIRPFVYFLTYRMKNKFNKESIYPEDYFKRMT